MHPAVRLALLPFTVTAVAFAADSSAGLPKKSPFELRGGAAAPVSASGETFEFAGVSSIGKKTDLIIYDKTAKKSHWIAPGETKEGIAVINYDAAREEAVVKVNGVQKTLALRKGGGPVGTARTAANPSGGFTTPLPAVLPAPASANLPVPNAAVTAAAPVTSGNTSSPTASAPPPPPGSAAEVQARQETEARMLVSDLLEIGMAQRRAYEEAQRKASGGAPAQSSGLPEPQAVQAQGQAQPGQPPPAQPGR
jgi:hypothetical protein